MSKKVIKVIEERLDILNVKVEESKESVDDNLEVMINNDYQNGLKDGLSDGYQWGYGLYTDVIKVLNEELSNDK